MPDIVGMFGGQWLYSIHSNILSFLTFFNVFRKIGRCLSGFASYDVMMGRNSLSS